MSQECKPQIKSLEYNEIFLKDDLKNCESTLLKIYKLKLEAQRDFIVRIKYINSLLSQRNIKIFLAEYILADACKRYLDLMQIYRTLELDERSKWTIYTNRLKTMQNQKRKLLRNCRI